MSIKRITIHQCLSVVGLEVDDREVHVLVAGGSPPWSGIVVTTFTDPVAREQYVGQVREWLDRGRPITAVEREGERQLVDEYALFSAALGPFE